MLLVDRRETARIRTFPVVTCRIRLPRLFAANVGIKFFTPEMHFLGEKETLPALPKSFAQQVKPQTSLFKGKAYEFDPKKRDSRLY